MVQGTAKLTKVEGTLERDVRWVVLGKQSAIAKKRKGGACDRKPKNLIEIVGKPILDDRLNVYEKCGPIKIEIPMGGPEGPPRME